MTKDALKVKAAATPRRTQSFTFEQAIRCGRKWLGEVRPGFLLSTALACAAISLRQLPVVAGLSPLLIALVLGAAFRSLVGLPPGVDAGIRFCMKYLLRVSIALLGLQLTTAQVVEIGPLGFTIVVVTVIVTFFFASWLGSVLHIRRSLTVLIAAGASICGASAIVAAAAITRSDEDDTAYAIACITLFGTASMLLYPLVGSLLHMTDRTYGLWVGASAYDVGQAIATAFQYGPVAGHIGTMAKLSRVMMLAPLLILLSTRGHARCASVRAADVPVPVFVLVFIVLLAVNSAWPIPSVPAAGAKLLTSFFFTVALAAAGLGMHVGKLRERSLRPLALGIGVWLFISICSAALVLGANYATDSNASVRTAVR